MGKEKFGTYLRMTYAPWTQGATPFNGSGGASTTVFNKDWTSTNTYEFGFLYTSNKLTWKFGFEMIQQPKLAENAGSSAAGAKHYDMSSELSVATPKVGLEIVMRQWPNSRLFAGVEYGFSTLTLQNSYSGIDTGVYAGMADFREELKGTSNLIGGMIGFETLMSDTTTVCLDVGYRSLSFAGVNHNVAATTFQGPVTVGQAANDNNGSARKLDMTGYYASLWFRIWVY